MMNSSTIGPKDNLSTSSCLAPAQRGRTLDISSLHLPATTYRNDPAEGVEPVTKLDPYNALQPEVIIKSKKEAIEEARKDNQGLVLWTDASKLNQGQTAAAVSWEDKSITKWKERSIFLGKNKEILDAEL